MLKSYLIAVIAVSGLMVAWALVQQLWRRVFDPRSLDSDVLEQRISCGRCGCARPCSTSDDDGRGHVSIDETQNAMGPREDPLLADEKETR